MNYPLLALDLDGTLLNFIKKISKENLNALKAYTAETGQVLIVTGRHYMTAHKYQTMIDNYTKCKSSYLVTLSGAAVYHNNQIMAEASKTIDAKIVDDFIKACHTYHVKYLIYFEELSKKIPSAIHTNSFFLKCHWRWFKKLKNQRNIKDINHAAYKLNMMSVSRKKLKKIQNYLMEKYPNLLNCYELHKYYFEIISSSVSKGKSIATVAEKLNIGLNHVAFAGDSTNDYSAFETVKLCAAICPKSNTLDANSSVTYHYHKNAISDFIHQYILCFPKTVKMLVSDVDGTFVTNEDKKVCDEAKQLLIKHCGKEIPYFCLATGRNVATTYAILKSIGFPNHKNCYFIANNGGLIYDIASNRLVYKKLLSFKDATTIFKTVVDENKTRKVGAIIHTCDENEMQKSISSELQFVSPLYTINYMFMRDMLRRIHLLTTIDADDMYYELNELPDNFKVVKFVLYLEDTKNRDEFMQKLTNMHLNITISSSGAKNIEITPFGINKGTSLKLLCDALNIKTNETLVCGDEMNDRQILKLTDWSYVMDHCKQEVKNTATYSVNAKPSYMVAESIKHYLEHRK